MQVNLLPVGTVDPVQTAEEWNKTWESDENLAEMDLPNPSAGLTGLQPWDLNVVYCFTVD